MSLATKVEQYRYHAREAARLAMEIEEGLQLLAPVRRRRRRPEVELIVRLVADDYGLSIHRILSRERSETVCHARQIAMVLLREHTRLVYQEIAEAFFRDHGTVIHAVRAVRDRRSTDPEFAARCERIAAAVTQALHISAA